MLNDMDERFWDGKQLARHSQLKEALLLIEERHWLFFRERPAIYAEQDHDRLYNHYFTRSKNDGYEEFAFLPGSDLPEPIRQECLEAFGRVYKS